MKKLLLFLTMLMASIASGQTVTFEKLANSRVLVSVDGHKVGINPADYTVSKYGDNRIVIGRAQGFDVRYPTGNTYLISDIDWGNCVPPQATPANTDAAVLLLSQDFFDTGLNAGGGTGTVNTAPLQNLAIITASTAGTYISGATTIGTGTGQVSPTDWIKQDLTSNGVTRVEVNGRFDHFHEDDPVTITFPAGTFTQAMSLIATREENSHTVPVNFIQHGGDPNVYVINRDNTIDVAHGVSFTIVGIK